MATRQSKLIQQTTRPEYPIQVEQPITINKSKINQATIGHFNT